jgi:tetratricopeptide (TPR) repeat protein
MYMTRKNVFLVAVLFLMSALYAEETDMALFNELSAAYSSGFYPGAVEYASRLEAAYPDSVFTGRALVMEGESFVHLGRSGDAEKVLEKARALVEKTGELIHACRYWEGRAQYAQRDYNDALLSFFDSCRMGGMDGQYYSSAVLYGGRSYYALGRYAEAVLPLGYVVSNGKKFSQQDYEEAVLKLADSYNRTGAYQQTTELYSSFSQNAVSEDVYELFSLYAGDAYCGSAQYRKAFDLYSAVLASGQKKFAVFALQKTYAVSSEHRNQVGTDAGTVFSQAQNVLADSPELVSEFWLRLGIDAYNRNDFERAKQYFNSAGDKATDTMKQIMALYGAEIIFNETGSLQASLYLEKAEKDARLEETGCYYKTYATLMLKYSALQEKWDDAKSYAAKIENPDENSRYYTACAYYSTKEYDTAVDIISETADKNSDVRASAVYARSLVKLQKIQDALSVYKRMENAGKIDDTTRLDYAETLLLAGKAVEAYRQAVQSRGNDALYVAGLAAFNSRDWSSAENCFSKYLGFLSDGSKYQQYALFYLGYAQYRLGESGAAYSSLAGFAEKYPGNELCQNARITAANAAVQNGEYEQAAMQAEEAVKTAPDEQSREKAVLLCSGIYTDTGNYTKALSVLSPYTMQKNPFGMKCLYETAQVFVKQGDIEKADNAYLGIARIFPSEELAEESMYRRGEIYYTAKRYGTALIRLSEYDNQYPDGRFTDASWFFGADCQAQQGNIDHAILQNNALIKKYPGSTYIYGAMKNLMALYRQTGDYDDALQQAQNLLKEYDGQALSDGIAEQARELEKLISGSSEAIVRMQSEFEQKGKLSTPEGRNVGTKLAVLYASSGSTLARAADLARQLLDVEKLHLDTESLEAAENAGIAGLYSRRTGKNKEAADIYLFAAEQYRANGKDDEAASALYNAADAFRAAGKDGDADETVKTLKKLYPRSRQSESLNSSGR